MAKIDSFFKPKLLQTTPKNAFDLLHKAVNGPDSNQNTQCEEKETLDDSLEDFEPPKEVIAKTEKIEAGSEENEGKSKSVVEVSYDDFLKASVSDKKCTKDDMMDKSGTNEPLDDSMEDFEPVKVTSTVKALKKTDCSHDKRDKDILKKKQKSLFDVLKWKSRKQESTIGAGDNDEQAEEADETAIAPKVKSVSSFFKKVSKEEAFLKAKITVEAKVEVHSPPTPPTPDRMPSPVEKKDEFMESNVAVNDQSLSMIECEEKEDYKKNKEKNMECETAVQKCTDTKKNDCGKKICEDGSIKENKVDEEMKVGEEYCEKKERGKKAEESREKSSNDAQMEEECEKMRWTGLEESREKSENGAQMEESREKSPDNVQTEQEEESREKKSVGLAGSSEKSVDDTQMEEEEQCEEKKSEDLEESGENSGENEPMKKNNEGKEDSIRIEIKVDADLQEESKPFEEADDNGDLVPEPITMVESVESPDSVVVSDISAMSTRIPSPVILLEDLRSDAKLKSPTSVPLVRADCKKTQSTLNFSASGISIARPKTKTPKKNTRKRFKSDKELETPKESNEGCRRSLRSRVSESETSVRRSARVKALESDVNEKNELEEADDSEDSEMYFASLVTPKKGKKKTPLKMKFTKLNESISEDSPLPRKDSKLTKAQELVRKAKEKKARSILKQSPSNSSELRRSCRRSAQVASESISLTMEEIIQKRNKKRAVIISDDDDYSPAKKKRVSPSKKNRKATKLAPIFQSKKKGEDVDVVESSDEEVKAIISEEEKELLRLRREFLFSSLPAEEKKPSTESVSIIDLPEAPWPTVSHVQQSNDNFDPPCDHKPLRLRNTDCNIKTPSAITLGLLTGCSQKPPTFEHCTRSKFSEESLKYLLAEVKTNNQAFPVYKSFRQLQKLKSNSAADEKDVTEVKESRRSKRGMKRSRNKEESNVETKNSKDCEQSLQWTEKYAPVHSSAFFSNPKAVKKVHSWLSEWKHRTDLNLRRAFKAEMLKAKRSGKGMDEIRKKYAEALWTDDLDDFDLSADSDSDLDESEDSLCNTMFIYGPHGSGKTSLVYALANELGYKIFEVNASSRRNGKQILSEMQEATQSHQVSMQTADAALTAPKKSPVKTAPVEKAKKTPKAFANFFGKKPEKSTPKPAKPKPQPKSSQQEPSKTVNLSGVSLILFEEADVVLEEDKGFWSAVQTLIRTTKRPILLTSSSAKAADKLNCSFESVHFKSPSPTNLASYLQLVALNEGLRSSYQDMHSVASFLKSDIRRCLLSLQFSLCSNIAYPIQLPVTYNRKYVTQSEPPKMKDNAADSDDDFELAPCKKRRKCRAFDEESDKEKNDSQASQDSQPDLPPFSPCVRDTESVELKDAKVVHRFLMESVSFSSPLCGSNTAVQFLRSKSKDHLIATSLAAHFRDMAVNLIHSNLLTLLPFKKSVSTFSFLQLSTPLITHCSRIANSTDLFESEESEDGFPSLKSNSRDSFEPEKIEIPTASTDEKLQKMIMAINDESFDEKPQNKHIARSLTSMASMYDTLSLTDTMFTSCEDSTMYASSVPGDMDISQKDTYRSDMKYTCEIASTIEVLQMRKCNSKIRKLKEKITKYSSEEITLPVDRVTDCVSVHQEALCQLSSADSKEKAVLRMGEVFPPRTEHRSFAVDVLPMIRHIFRAEQLRAASGRKRRFLHYLDPLINELKDTVISTLCSAF